MPASVTKPQRQESWWLFVLVELLICLCPFAAQAQSSTALWQTYMRSGISAFINQRYSESEALLQLALSEAEQQPGRESLVLLSRCVLHDLHAEVEHNIVESGRCADVTRPIATPEEGLTDVAGAILDLAWHLNDVAKQKASTDQKDPKYDEQLRQAQILRAEAENYSIFAFGVAARSETDKLAVMLDAAETALLSFYHGDYTRSIELYDSVIEQVESLTRESGSGDASIVKPVVLVPPATLGYGNEGDKIDLSTLLILCAKAYRQRGIQEATQAQPDFASAEQDFFDSETRVARAMRMWLEAWTDHPYTMETFDYFGSAYQLRAALYEKEKSAQRTQEVRVLASQMGKLTEQKPFDLRQALPLAGSMLRLDGHADRDSRMIERAGELVAAGAKVQDAIARARRETQPNP